jgi:acetoacetate decarboxylase
MRSADILKLPSMPMAGPSYPAGPYRFVNREFLVITYETDPDLIRAGLPEPLEPNGSRCRIAPASAATRNPAW